jgi:hypothetical protein
MCGFRYCLAWYNKLEHAIRASVPARQRAPAVEHWTRISLVIALYPKSSSSSSSSSSFCHVCYLTLTESSTQLPCKLTNHTRELAAAAYAVQCSLLQKSTANTATSTTTATATGSHCCCFYGVFVSLFVIDWNPEVCCTTLSRVH